MKHCGCNSLYKTARTNEIMRLIRNEMSLSKHIDILSIARKISKKPMSRFWVSEERAYAVYKQIEKVGINKALSSMRGTKREMFSEIYYRVKKLQEEQRSLTDYEAVTNVVQSEAPEIYMKARCIVELFYQTQRRERGILLHKAKGK